MSPAPPMPLTYEMLHDRADALRRYAAQVRPTPDHLKAVRVFIRDCLLLPADCQVMAAEVRHQAFDVLMALKPGSTYDPTPLLERRRLTELVLDALTAVVEACIALVAAPALSSKLAAEAGSLQGALTELRRVREDFSENFPVPNDEQRQQAREEHLRADFLDLDDAFAQIAGCSKEDWSRRVEARQASRKGK